MHRSHSFSPIRAVPVAFALIFNIAMGPLAPVVQSQLLGNQTAMAYVGDPSTFELDGNATTQSSHDWDQVYNDRNGPPFSSSGADNLVFTSDTFGAGDNILTGGSTKDINDMSSWLWKQSATTSVQDKDDIENAFAAAYTATNGHSIGVFGLDRYSISGNATAGFWFFKNAIAQAGNGSGNGTGFTGTHAEGDILVVIDFTNGGALGTATVYKWHNGALALDTSGTECDSSSQSVCAITNLVATPSPWPFTPKAGTANVFPADSKGGAGALYEGGIDLTALGLDTGCFSSFMAETRSSQEPSSTLSDFVLGNFSFCAPPDLETKVSTGSVSVGDSVTDDATLTGTKGNIGGSVDFYVCGPTASAQDCASTANKVSTETIADPGNPVTVTSDAFTANAAGWYCFLAVYNPPAGSKYLTTSHSNNSTECFQAKPAEVHVTKTADAASVSAGDPIGFTVTVSNSGTGTAKGVTLDDVLPAGNAPHPVHWVIDSSKFDYGSFAISGADGSQSLALAGQPISLAAGASLKVHISAATTKDNCATYDNTASVASTNDGSPSASASESVLCPHLYVTKTHDHASVSAGSPIGFTVVVGNNGTGNATGVTLNDPLPGGNGAHPVHWAIDGSTGNPASFAISGADGSQVLSLAGQPIGLNAGASLAVHVTARTTEENCATYDNTASVASTNDGSPSASASETVRCPNLSITKVADATPVDAGDPIGFAITVSNSSAPGTGTATDVTLSDPLPAGVAWSISPAYAGPGTCTVSGAVNAQTLSCSFDDMAPGASATVHLSATTSTVACATYPNTATADATNQDPITASATIECRKPDLTATKTATPAGPVNAGQPIGFTITVSNSDAEGTGTAKAVTLSDPLPAGSDLDWSINPAYGGPGTCSITGAVGSETLNCSFGNLAPGDSATVHLVSDTSNSEGDCTTFTNVATVAATNHATLMPQASVTVQCPGLNVAKTTDTPSINGGDQAEFTIAVWNLGDGTALGATLTDPLPAGASGNHDWSISPAYSGPGTCSITGAAGNQTLSCSFGDLAGGTSKDSPSASISLVATTSREDCGSLTNTATVDASNNDPRSSTASIDVTCPVIEIVKANNQPDPVLPGTDVTYTLTVTVSDGPANDVVVVDTLPAGLDAPTSISDSGVWDSGARTITWTFSSLADGAKLLSYHAKVSAGDTHGQTLTNNVYVTSPNTECPNMETLAHECRSSSVVTVRVPILVIEKAASVDEVHFVFHADGTLKSVSPANAQVTWTLTYTLTNGPVTNAVISDPLPAFLTFVSAGNGGTYDAATRTVTWQFATLSESGVVSFVSTVAQDAPETGPIVNVASIVSDQTPKDEGQDSVRVTSEEVLAAVSSPNPSVPNTATVAGPSGAPIQIPIELLVLFFLSSFGTLTFANVRAVRRRR